MSTVEFHAIGLNVSVMVVQLSALLVDLCFPESLLVSGNIDPT
jgi:hypothetical protein